MTDVTHVTYMTMCSAHIISYSVINMLIAIGFPVFCQKMTYSFPEVNSLLNGSVQQKLRWAYNSVIRWTLALALFWIFNLPSSRIEHNFVSSQYSGLNRRFLLQKAKHSEYLLRQFFVFVSFMLCQYNWSCDLYSPVGEAQWIKKIRKNFYWRCKFASLHLLAWRKCPTLLWSAGCNVAPITVLYSANTVGSTLLVALHLFFQNAVINWTILETEI